jgi:hypothetical protein
VTGAGDPRSLLEAVLAATPPPPGPETDAEEVLAAAEAVIAARQRCIEDAGPVGAPCGPAGDRLQLLVDRDALWRAALLRARHAVAERMAGAPRRRAVRGG